MYIVIPDTSPSHELADYTDEYGSFYIIYETFAANPVVTGNAMLVDDISAYSLLPSIIASRQTELQSFKNNAINKLTKALEVELAAGVVVTNDNLKMKEMKVTKRAKGSGESVKVGTTNSIVLDGSANSLVAFTQGATLIATAAAAAPDPVAFGNMQVSAIFGRPVTDALGNAIELTVNQFRQLVLVLGGIVGGKQGSLSDKISQITAATSKTEIEAILNS